jgi:hypothetical protein
MRERQRACASAECQIERRRRTQAAWRAANPDYFVARRLAQLPSASAPAMGSTAPEVPRMTPPLDRLPWDIAQDEFGAKGAGFIAVFGRVLLRGAQDAMRVQVLDTS